jgi:O-antigen/teichoic acid export membrane protein
MIVSARALGAKELGVVVLIHAFAQFVGDVMKFQSWQTLLRYGAGPLAAGERQRFQAVLRFSAVLDLISTLVGLAVGVVGAVVFADWLGWGEARAPAAALYMATIAVMVSATPIGLMRLLDRFEVLATQTALVGLLRLTGCLIAWAVHAPLEGFLLAWAFGQFGGFAWLAAITWKELKARDLIAGFRWRGPLAEGMPGVWRFAWNTNLSAGLDVAMGQAATLVVGALLGPAAAGFWRIGRQVADAIAKPARLLTAALYPELTRMRGRGDHDDVTRLARSVGLTAGGVVMVLLLVSALFGPSLLKFALGPAFVPAAAAMSWQVGATAIGAFALPLEPMLMTQGRAGDVVRVQLVVSLLFIAALPLLLLKFGLAAGGMALMAAEAGLALGWLAMVLRQPKRA